MKNKVCLMILDGWGIGREDRSNAIYIANTPFMDNCMKTCPNSTLKTFGQNVGLPDGQMGNSEVGHMNIGAGRIVFQDLVRINNSIDDHSFFTLSVLRDAIEDARLRNATLHLMGLVSDGGVHSHQMHLHAILDLCYKMDFHNVKVHAFTDGRDCDPHSGRDFIRNLESHIESTTGQIASVIGRYYAMDRDKRWERIRKAYDLLIKGEGMTCSSALQGIEESYKNGITDEFIEPLVIKNDSGNPIGVIEENDVVICFNFRTDRCREITTVLTQEDMPDHGMKTLPLRFITMTNYDDDFKGVEVVFDKDNLKNTLGEVLARNYKKQIRIAETEKYPHVTFFFSGGLEDEFDQESRIMINSPKVATYDLKPEMSAKEVTEAITSQLKKEDLDFVCLNFANPDMVGHTGDFEAIVKACEFTDHCSSIVAKTCSEMGFHTLITADHGNADYAVNDDGSPNTAHSMNLVPLIYYGSENIELKDGILADLAPTILDLMDLRQPDEMTGKTLIQK